MNNKESIEKITNKNKRKIKRKNKNKNKNSIKFQTFSNNRKNPLILTN